MTAKEMPLSCGAWRCEYEPIRREVANPRLAGDVDAFETATPRWGMRFSIEHPTNAQLQEWRAWLLSLRGGQGTFLAWDYKSPVPRAYMGDASSPAPFASTQITAINAANRTISISGYAANGVLTAGDPISWFDGRNWVRVVATTTMTADGSGVISDIPVEPALQAHPGVSGYALPIDARLRYACCEMRINPDSISIPSDYTQGGTISFDAYQIVRRS